MPESPPIPPASRIVTFRNAFISGLLLLAPLIVTIWIFVNIIGAIGGVFRPFWPETLRNHQALVVLSDVITTVIVVVLVTLLGFVSRDVFGKFFVSVAERFMLNIPGLNGVYATVKQIVDTFSSKNKLFNKVVMVEFPRQGTWAVGFLTNRARGEPQSKTADDVWTVFIPTSPNPTSGFLLLVPVREIVELDMSVGDGMKMIISGGAVVPPWSGPRTSG